MTSTVCRTCLTVLRENSHAFFTLENGVPGITTFREKLNCCIPELALDIIPNAVICTTCSRTLNLAYDFKTKCLETETKVRRYLQDFDDIRTEWFTDIEDYIDSNHLSNKNINRYSAIKQVQDFRVHVEASHVNIKNIKSEASYHEHQLKETRGDHSETNDSLNDISTTDTKNNLELIKNTQALPLHHDTVSGKLQEQKQLKDKTDLDIKTENINCESNFKYEELPQDYSRYFTMAIQKLKDKTNEQSAAYRQAFQHFNLLKIIQSLANQGTEINIKGNSYQDVFSETTGNLNSAISTPNSEDISNNLQQKKPAYERYDCYYCNRSFDRLSLLKTHTISHTGVKPFTCNICGKGCSHKGELNNHIRTHTGEKPFKCTLCEASFSQISNMKIHMRTHTGEKPYKCNYCEKTFSHKCGVKVHMRTHTGERPYKCEICLKTYTHKKDLDDHIRTHTGEKYRCPICFKEITYKKNLSAHMITHSSKSANALDVLKKTNGLKYKQETNYLT